VGQRIALVAAVRRAARAAGSPFLELEQGFVAHGPHPWRRFLDRAPLSDLRTAITRLDARQFRGSLRREFR
jgi:hypothetical protein